MKAFDRFLQRWRISKVRPFVREGDRVLDIGCYDGALFRQLHGFGEGVGVDPGLACAEQSGRVALIKGRFPADLPDDRPFQVIVMTAVLEHFPEGEHPRLAADCARWLVPGGHLVITVPSPLVDPILHVLRALRLLQALTLEQHYGFDARKALPLFQTAGLRLVRRERFQLGLNNLYVFQKPPASP